MDETEATTQSLWERCGDTTPRDRRNQRLFLWMAAGWAVTFLAAHWLIGRELLPPGPVSWVVMALPTAAGLLVCFSYARYLRQADELQRLNQLWALGLGFGAGWLALSGYPLLEQVGAPAMDPDDYSVVMVAFFSLGILLGRRRYR